MEELELSSPAENTYSNVSIKKFYKQFSGPHRKDDSSFFDNGLTTTNTIRFHVDKPIVRTPRPSDFNLWLVQHSSPGDIKNAREPLDIVDSLATHRKWTSSATFAMQESALPTPKKNVPATTQEMHVDPVSSGHRSHNNRYNAPMLWQQLGRKWDSVQLRGSYSARRRLNDCYSKLISSKEKAPYVFKNLQFITNNKADHPDDTFRRQIPAYRGYIPKFPIPVAIPKDHVEENCSITQWKFPSYEYEKVSHCHTGPFSKSVVLTSPHNPFNKIDP